MKYLNLFASHDIATLVDWLAEKGQLLVHFYLPHSGGAGSSYPITSLPELRELISNQTHPEIEIVIFKNIAEETEENVGRIGGLVEDKKWLYSYTNEVMFFSVHKNRNYSSSYEANPEKYEEAIRQWQVQT